MPPRTGPVVVLVAVDNAVLEALVDAATGESANEVTPPLTPGGTWTPERIEWLRRLHRDCRAGLDGPASQATWAVTEGGHVVGAVRLGRTEEDGVLETGIWLTRDTRGRGVGQVAISAVLDRATALGAGAVRADTTSDNAAALSVLRRLGFELSPTAEGQGVRALRRLS